MFRIATPFTTREQYNHEQKRAGNIPAKVIQWND
jgi:hypothetical protein